jgi:hypothetical protein
MSKRPGVAILMFLLGFARLLADDWKTQVMGFLEPGRDFAGAAACLRDLYAKVNADDKPNALSFLAFLERRSGRPEAEAQLIVEYFETYKNIEPVFLILDDTLRRDFIAFWARWKSTYPLASDLIFLERSGDADALPPQRLLVGLDLANSAYYKISAEGGVIEGGLWQPGFHILRLPFTGGCDRSGSLDYDLDLKVGNLVVRKRFTVDVDVRSERPALSLTEPPAGSPPAPPRAKPISGEVSLYIDDALILKSKKIAVPPAPIRFKLPGPSAQGTKPYMAPRKDIPQFNGVSILDAVGLLYKTIRDLGKKKKEASISPPVYRKAAQVAFSFSRTGPSGEVLPYRALVSLRVPGGTLLRR